MNVFNVHKEIINEYSEYISSFIDIKDERIKSEVQNYLNNYKLWPEPLIQFNPSYELGESINQLCKENIFNKKLELIFGDYKLYKHQVDAIKLGIKGKSFIVTSGTGSGKSLTYIATIFNYLLNNNSINGVKALVVYPMNALINSQTLEFNKFKVFFEKKTNEKFPITFNQYTGQENEQDRQLILNSPPDILLTNYMMLELIMTRNKENVLRDSIIDNLRFIVFDELHTYRGRQGADVSMLIRRIKSQCKNKLVFMGTSATLISNDSKDDQKEKIVEVVSKIFSENFTNEQIITESLIPSIHSYNLSSISDLKEVVNKDELFQPKKDELLKNPLTSWLEKNCAIDDSNVQILRRNPITLSDISEKLSKDTGIPRERCKERIIQLLLAINEYNSSKPIDYPSILPFKIHQFISQTGSVYVTLESPNEREIFLEYTPYKFNKDNEKKPLFSVVFSRISGYDFICVKKDGSKLYPRDFVEKDTDDWDDELDIGYIIFDDNEEIWQSTDIQKLPDSWLNIKRNGEISVKTNYEKSIPQRIYFDQYGNFSEKNSKYPFKGWYISFPLLFDPTCGVFYDRKTKESTKLSKLGIEGRSTSTTVLSLAAILALSKDNVGYKEQKVLSFTDNRQDAALQSGHFNDYYKIVKIRSAIYRALSKEESNQLDFSNIAIKTFSELNLSQEQYANKPISSQYPAQAKENENTFINLLTYRILYDLRRGWRVTLPNLEQCGLLTINYKYLEETIKSERFKESVRLAKNLSEEKLLDLLTQILDYFRKNYILKHFLLEKNEISQQTLKIREQINNFWGLNKNEEILLPAFARIESINSNANIFTVSLGLQSYFGKFIRLFAQQNNIPIDSNNYNELVYELLNELSLAGYLHKTEINSGQNKIPLYQLNVSNILWCKGDGHYVRPDKVRLYSYKEYSPKVNEYFKKLYQSPFNSYKNMISFEHTAQIKNEDRIIREKEFRDGNISLLCCSPTMELGIDISTLNIVHMRNVPPNPANYAQRSGRAGRSGQAALVLTFCSNYSPHDQHYFKNPVDMVSGIVQAQRIDLINEELLVTHLHSLYLSECGIAALDKSINYIIDVDKLEKLPIKGSVLEQLKINETRKDLIYNNFKNAIRDFENKLLEMNTWYNDEWIRREINNAPEKFDKSFDRWRELFKSANKQKIKAQEIINNPNLTNNSKEKKAAYAEQKQANKQIDILLNSTSESGGNLSEFYPYRYLAAEGFLPGYNFTRLPIRAYVSADDDGEFISRPRFLALREFGPLNIIYHNSAKYKVSQLLLSDIESKIQKMKISKTTGYALLNDDYNRELCPFTDTPLKTSDDVIIYCDLLQMGDMRTNEIEKISCEEEERVSIGYDISTYFTVKGGLDRVKTALIKDGKDELLKLRFIPTATLIKVNERWRTRQEEGFLISYSSGFWKKEKDLSNKSSDLNRIRLFTEDTADALYIHPLKALAFDNDKTLDSIITLMYALKRGIENVFQAEPNEIGVELMGDLSWPNILIYEAAEGSLGILSQFTQDINRFKQVIKEAYSICHFHNGLDTDPLHRPATYSDLLSYYNQRFHQNIDRFLIKNQLEKLLKCSLEILGNSSFNSYDEQYQYLLDRIDPNSSTELNFINYLYKNGYRLPDEAQVTIPEIYVKPDFFYNDSKTCIFCDGSPHDDKFVRENDTQKRELLLNKGYDVIVYYYRDSIEKIINQRPDIFRKVR